MNESANAPASGSASSDDFVDFYQLLGAAPDATTTHLRRRINELYSEAQSNRDHRNVNKRRQYEALCELLPYCRIVLLDPDKRARYDRYMAQSQSGTAGLPSFESMMEEIAGSVGDVSGDNGAKAGLLGVEGDDDYLPVSTTTEAATVPTPRTIVSPGRDAPPDIVTLAGAAGSKKRLSKSAMSSLTGSVFSVMVFAAVAIITWLLTHHNVERAILFAAIAGLLTWIVTHMRKGGGGQIRR